MHYPSKLKQTPKRRTKKLKKKSLLMQFLCSYELKIKSFRLITLTKKLKTTKQNK
jgi:hypothetical protein